MHQNLLCILIHILKSPTQSFSSMPCDWRQFFCLFFSFSQIGAVSLSVDGNQNSLNSSPGKTIYIRLQNKKKGNKI